VAELDRILVLQTLEVMADRRARAAGNDPVEPLRTRRSRRRSDDLDGLPADQRRAQRISLPSARAATAWLPTSVCTK
jgi:hypothetical protein